MRNTQGIKFFLTLLLCTGFIFSCSNYGVLAYDKLFLDQFGDNTIINSVDISGLSEKKALALLKAKQKEWARNTTLIIQYKEKSSKLNVNVYEFQLERSLKIAKSHPNSELSVGIARNNLNGLLKQLSPDLLINKSFDLNKLKSDLINYASMLKAGTHVIQLQNYISGKQPVELISEASIPIEENSKELSMWVKQYSTQEIGPQSAFSLLALLDDNSLKTYSTKTLSMISTAIYKVVVPTNFLITERHISRNLPDYAELGFEAKANPNNNMDFIFINPNKQNYNLKFKIINQLFYVSLEGPRFQYSYEGFQNDKETFAPKTIIQYDAKLPLNSEKIAVKGKEGVIIKMYREKKDENGALLSKTLISEDFYPPINQVIIHSLLQSSTTSVDNSINSNQQNEAGTTSTPTEETTGSSVDGENTNSSTTEKDANKSEENTTNDLWGNDNEVSK